MIHNPHTGLWSTSCSWSKKYYKVERHLLFSFKLKRIFFLIKKCMSLINLYSEEEEEEEEEEEDLFVFNED